ISLLGLPVPSRAPPRSFTTTFAPRDASSIACARPSPPPAPVTMATRPSNRTSLTGGFLQSIFVALPVVTGRSVRQAKLRYCLPHLRVAGQAARVEDEM